MKNLFNEIKEILFLTSTSIKEASIKETLMAITLPLGFLFEGIIIYLMYKKSSSIEVIRKIFFWFLDFDFILLDILGGFVCLILMFFPILVAVILTELIEKHLK